MSPVFVLVAGSQEALLGWSLPQRGLATGLELLAPLQGRLDKHIVSLC